MAKNKISQTTLSRQEIEVWADWDWMAEPRLMGTLFVSKSRGKEIFSFEYDADWIRSDEARVLDPSLQLDQGLQYADPARGNFGLFLDSSPDRWGRVLMQRRESRRARIEKRASNLLGESDFLLGVHDLHRMGGIRFKKEPAGAFVDHDQVNSAPPWAMLRELESASFELENSESKEDEKVGEWLRILLAPGSSLGGARPKASVVDASGRLWIAKFSSRSDRYDVGAWEMLVNELARRISIRVPPAKIEKLAGTYRTFLSERFDRTPHGKRIHFSSAMNLLQRRDGDDHATGTSYLELVDLIVQLSAEPERDLEELWRRIVFFICVSNTDDHLRNHGFLLQKNGWRLSPAYDLNPVPFSDGLKLNISESENAQNLDLAFSVAAVFRINISRAREIAAEAVRLIRKWPELADQLRISKPEQELMKPAFRVADSN